MKSINNKFKHITANQRLIIAKMLDDNKSLTQISLSISKDKSAVSREIIRHRYILIHAKTKNKCGNFQLCFIKHLCNKCQSGLCKFCGHNNCNFICHSFQDYPECRFIARFPHVCNGCSAFLDCKLPKYIYNPIKANSNYIFNISNHKLGPKVDEATLALIDSTIKAGLDNNHSIDLIINSNNLGISVSTAYSYIWNNYLSVKPLDLKRALSYKPRKKTKKTSIIDYDYRKNRTYQDYLNYIQDYNPTNIWQMDTIEGKKGHDQHSLLSLLHTRSNLQLFFKMKDITIESVISVLDGIKEFLGYDVFKESFSVILTDNGKEFRDSISMEIMRSNGEFVTHVFYCDPRRSDQKGKCEKNHVHFRERVKKGKSLNDYTQTQINEISNNINNYPRRMFNFNSPYQLAVLMLNKKVLELNNLDFIPTNKVKL